ncbi:MAG: NlpC/P60 family protein [Chthoniobacter sp.]|nr:NlpC/P60 family protein [Chthoniobacter sp.]
MNRFSTLMAALTGVALILGSPAESHAAKKKKPAAESADDDASTPAPKHPATPPLNLPLPSKTKAGGSGDSTPDKNASGGDATPAPKTTDKTGDGAEKSGDKTGAEPKAKTEHAPNATVEPDTITEFATQPPRIQQLIRDAIDLTRLNLTYTFGSADPDAGGMDCSGTIYYLLHAHNFADVPRDSSGQYLWARRGGAFFPVVSKSAESVEFKELLPGDLMFWTGTYETGRDVPISHVMMYLGREKGSGKRIMFGASDGRSYNGIQRWGVSVFDFKMPGAGTANPEKAKVEFVGYARIPSLRGPAPAPLVAEEDSADAAKKDAPAATPAPGKSKKSGTTTGRKKKKPSSD